MSPANRISTSPAYQSLKIRPEGHNSNKSMNWIKTEVDWIYLLPWTLILANLIRPAGGRANSSGFTRENASAAFHVPPRFLYYSLRVELIKVHWIIYCNSSQCMLVQLSLKYQPFIKCKRMTYFIKCYLSSVSTANKKE